jgi:hypothetical protein
MWLMSKAYARPERLTPDGRRHASVPPLHPGYSSLAHCPDEQIYGTGERPPSTLMAVPVT